MSSSSSSSRLHLAALLCALVLAGCAGHQEPQKAPPSGPPLLLGSGAPSPAASIAVAPGQAAQLYASICQSCHGPQGRAQTPLARSLTPWPRDLESCNFKYRSTPSGSLPSDEDLLRTLYVGLPGSAMPSFARLLSRAELEALVLQVKQRCARFASEQPDPPLPAPGHALYDQESVKRGQAIYRREGCASCHGAGGHGDGKAADTLRDAKGRKLRPRDYTKGVYRSGFDLRDIYRAFSTGLNGTPMPALADSVSEAERWDLTNYLVSFSSRRNRVWRALEQAPSWYEPITAWGRKWR